MKVSHNQEIKSMETLCATLNLSVQVSPPMFTVDPEGWEHFLFSYTLLRNGKPIHSGTYRKGSGHVKLVEPEQYGPNRLSEYEGNILRNRIKRPSCKILPSFQGELFSLYNKLAAEQKLSCTASELMGCLVMDTQGAEQSFSSWCGDLGYDEDSRKAYGIYQECQGILQMLQKNFSMEELAALQEAASEL